MKKTENQLRTKAAAEKSALRSIKQLQEENQRLSRLAETDWLTGVYNRGAAEQKINEAIKRYRAGVLIIVDIDHFKQVNDRFGHIVGDQLLREIVQVLGKMFFKDDIIGRIGGDEFVVYLPVRQDEEFLNERCRQIKARFREMKAQKSISVTVCGAVYQNHDDYSRLFDRADQMLIQEKMKLRQKVGQGTGLNLEEVAGMGIDMKLISHEMQENDRVNGALCQDYETFKSIYCYTIRRIKRTQGNACIILFTLTDGNNHYPPYTVRGEQMELLAEVIQSCLRAGDVFTQYSSCQFLTMVADATMENIDVIAKRISQSFYRKIPGGQTNCLLHHGYPVYFAEQEEAEADKKVNADKEANADKKANADKE